MNSFDCRACLHRDGATEAKSKEYNPTDAADRQGFEELVPDFKELHPASLRDVEKADDRTEQQAEPIRPSPMLGSPAPEPARSGSPPSPPEAEQSKAEESKKSESGSQKFEKVKKPKEPEPPFNVVLDKSAGGTLGVDLDKSDGWNLRVVRVKIGGLVERWNAAHPDQCIAPGDAFLSVNGNQGGVMARVQELMDNNRLDISVQKSKEIRIAITKEGRDLGLDLDSGNQISLIVQGLDPQGLIGAWNNDQDQECRMKYEDVILQVNGVRGEAAGMLSALHDNNELEIFFAKRF